MQVLPLQQPLGQVDGPHGVHTPTVQTSPLMQPTQVAPVVPQFESDWFSWRTQPVLSQQPFGQVVELHGTQTPLSQASPLAQALQAAPPVPHPALV